MRILPTGQTPRTPTFPAPSAQRASTYRVPIHVTSKNMMMVVVDDRIVQQVAVIEELRPGRHDQHQQDRQQGGGQYDRVRHRPLHHVRNKIAMRVLGLVHPESRIRTGSRESS
ncbi:hypothetical protein BVRB_022960 [Beta vulgaris subsp. vulgaris]|uniref:Uncharacterized protein n=1 Tax=Beta vulgaris subsp. vulgaris TaxID=3555 RepID=A0A0J8AZU0_BETVV|nr:hypothetical protein BVRB_022960 [Beta vulgaris subsp. vulgaris]